MRAALAGGDASPAPHGYGASSAAPVPRNDDDLLRALVGIAMRGQKPDAVVVELSGVADPTPVLTTLLERSVRAAFRVTTLVAVVDARHVLRTLQDHPEAPGGLIRLVRERRDLAASAATARAFNAAC